MSGYSTRKMFHWVPLINIGKIWFSLEKNPYEVRLLYDSVYLNLLMFSAVSAIYNIYALLLLMSMLLSFTLYSICSFLCLRADPENAQRNALVLVSYNGVMTWVPHQSFKSSCSIDVTNFPFDNQACHLWFGSWTHT